MREILGAGTEKRGGVYSLIECREWSGAFDVYNSRVTHIHCLPPAPLAWLQIYVVGSSSDHGIHLLDFYPGSSSLSLRLCSHFSCCLYPSSEDIQTLSEIKKHKKQNRFVPLSEGVTACVSHPFNSTIVVRTKNSSLLEVTQKQQCTSDSMLEWNNEEAGEVILWFPKYTGRKETKYL
ncbi:hypothetical protein WN943_009562 [Citrus x changshan-huyou]